MKTLIILNDPPYGTERSYNALRLAGHLAKREGEQVRIFLIGDAAACAKRNQKVPPGYYNVETMLGAIVRDSAQIGVCGTCMDARGIADQDIAAGAHRSAMKELTDWTLWADRVVTF
ncbi:MAG TPA: DsrE family protein [Burkholderiales bacterium]|nr:DsrE family protein [Burkholderiales bacterium]